MNDSGFPTLPGVLGGETREDIVSEARGWMRTPYVHQGRTRHGLDCAGLLIVVARELQLVSSDFDVTGYGRVPDGTSLVSQVDRFMRRIPLADLQPGDAVAIRWQRDPQHLGIVGDYRGGLLSVIHALSRSDGRGEVIEHRLTPELRSQVVAAWAFPGIA